MLQHPESVRQKRGRVGGDDVVSGRSVNEVGGAPLQGFGWGCALALPGPPRRLPGQSRAAPGRAALFPSPPLPSADIRACGGGESLRDLPRGVDAGSRGGRRPLALRGRWGAAARRGGRRGGLPAGERRWGERWGGAAVAGDPGAGGGLACARDASLGCGFVPREAGLPLAWRSWCSRERSLAGRTALPPLARPVRAGVPPPGVGSTSRAGEEVSWCRLGYHWALLTCFSHKLVSIIWLTSSWKTEVCRERRRPSRRPRAPRRGGYSPPSPAGTWTPRTGWWRGPRRSWRDGRTGCSSRRGPRRAGARPRSRRSLRRARRVSGRGGRRSLRGSSTPCGEAWPEWGAMPLLVPVLLCINCLASVWCVGKGQASRKWVVVCHDWHSLRLGEEEQWKAMLWQSFSHIHLCKWVQKIVSGSYWRTGGAEALSPHKPNPLDLPKLQGCGAEEGKSVTRQTRPLVNCQSVLE